MRAGNTHAKQSMRIHTPSGILLPMYYILGLGNPGDEYTHTRHNVGKLALDAIHDAGAF